MCELFAMCSREPTSVGFSLQRLARRGGAEGPHRDGWGVAFYAERDALLLREPGAASESGLVRYIEDHGPPSAMVISHIRLATFGESALRNTQPFMRELGGRAHVFAHNGDLPGWERGARPRTARFRPVGESDSEAVFCQLLTRLAVLWDRQGNGVPMLAERLEAVAEFAATLRAIGIANFLYSDSDALFVHAHHRIPDGTVKQPGLHLLQRSCEESVPDLTDSGIRLRTVQQALTLVASAPLTGEDWCALDEGEVLAIQRGSVTSRLRA